ncbi:MAG: hypothetical protein ACLTXL_12075 [Clostridia bacterium]
MDFVVWVVKGKQRNPKISCKKGSYRKKKSGRKENKSSAAAKKEKGKL